MEVINLDDSLDTNSLSVANTSTSMKVLRKRKKSNKKSRREEHIVQVIDSDATLSPSSSTLNIKRKKKSKGKKKRLSIVILDSDDEHIVTKVNKERCATDCDVIEISDSEGEGVVSGHIETTKLRNWKNNQNITCNIPTSVNRYNNITRKNEHNTKSNCNSNNNNNNKMAEISIPLKHILSKNNENFEKMQECDNSKIICTAITSESSSKIVTGNQTQKIVTQENPCSSLSLWRTTDNISITNYQLANYKLFETSHKSTRNSISYQPEDSKIKKNGPRPIVIDGSNVAFGHGKERFSAKGIQICIEYFIRRNHKEIRAFIPQFRRRHHTTIGIHILDQLEKDGHLIYTPSRQVEGRRITSYDDRFIVEYATKTGGVIVSRDNYKDLLKENRTWSDTINYRVLQYTFVGDMIMFPQDPLGQGGPTLERFLMY